MEQILELEGHVYSVDFLRNDPDGQKILRHAYEGGKVFCCTCSEERAPVHVYCRKKKLYLARYRATGQLHEPSCDDYLPELLAARKTRALKGASAIKAVGNRFVCNLNLPLSLHYSDEVSPSLTNAAARNRRSSRSDSSTTLTGLLLFLLEESGLCRHNPAHPNPVDWQFAGKRMLRTIDRIDLMSGPLSNHVALPLLHNQALVDQRINEIRYEQGQGEQKYMFAIGRIARWSASQNDIKCWLENLSKPLIFTVNAWAAMASRSWSAHAETTLLKHTIKSNMEHVVLACRLRLDEAGRLCVVNGSVVMTAHNWIPVQSKYERETSDELVRSNLHFNKPIRPLPNCPFVPDFLVLIYGDIRSPFEVAGLAKDPNYAEHLAHKLCEYPKYFAGPAWVWIAGSEPMPPVLFWVQPK